MITPHEFASMLEAAIQPLPPDFYSSYSYTQTGNNLTHPVTVGLIAKLLLRNLPAGRLALDLRLNEGEHKFQPDLAMLDDGFDPILYVDYESPNSSDARIPEKDVRSFAAWTADFHDDVPYFIVTTLPDGPSPTWELRHTGAGQANAEFAGPQRASIHAQIRRNPFQFWMAYYRAKIASPVHPSIALLNINRKAVMVVDLA